MDKIDFKKYKIQQYYKTKFKNKVLANKYIQKRKNDVIYRIIDNLSRRAYKFLKKYNVKLQMTHIDLIGCEPYMLKEYLSSKFKNNMSFENYGEWDVDHIKPITLYDLTNIEQVKLCFNYKNLQPLYHIDNLRKSNKYNL